MSSLSPKSQSFMSLKTNPKPHTPKIKSKKKKTGGNKERIRKMKKKNVPDVPTQASRDHQVVE